MAKEGNAVGIFLKILAVFARNWARHPTDGGPFAFIAYRPRQCAACSTVCPTDLTSSPTPRTVLQAESVITPNSAAVMIIRRTNRTSLVNVPPA